MERRTYLGSLGAAGLAGIAGCLDTLGLSNDDSQTTLSPPEDHLTGASYQVHGEEFPSFAIPDPIAETTVSLEDFVGERPFVITHFFTTCPDGICPALLTRLRWIQEDAKDRDYEGDIGLLAFTFDPERDTPEVLKEHASNQGLDYDAEAFHFLRPESNEKAQTLMNETFGVPIQRVEEGEGEGDAGGNETEDHSGRNETGDHSSGNETGDHSSGNETGDHSSGNETGDHSNGNETQNHSGHDHGEYTFTHTPVLTLVNEDGIVERAYPKAVQSEMAVTREQLLEDVRTVVGVE